MIPSNKLALVLALISSAALTVAQSDNVTCTSDPAGWALSCLQSSVTGCSSSDISCLCSSFSSDGNVQIFDSKCLSDGCFNNPQPSATSPAQVTAAFSSAVAAQSSMCSSNHTTTATVSAASTTANTSATAITRSSATTTTATVSAATTTTPAPTSSRFPSSGLSSAYNRLTLTRLLTFSLTAAVLLQSEDYLLDNLWTTVPL